MSKSRSNELLDRLLGLHPKKIDLSLGRMQRLLSALGNPEKKCPPVIHVAGTNGKGSVTAYLRAMLEAAGYSVHVYTSPHLVQFHERIRLAGKLISEDYLAECLEACETANGNEPITFFEVTTAAAFYAFANTPADVLILEVGLGGRLDATNVIDNPLVSVITPISMDHEQFLGNELVGIAAEKAGIIKAGCPVVSGPQDHDVQMLLEDKASDLSAPIAICGQDWMVETSPSGFYYHDNRGGFDMPPPALFGPHQMQNAGIAIAALRAQHIFEVSRDQMEMGLLSVVWPARLQQITQGRLYEQLPSGCELWLDGGHNPAAGRVLAEHFAKRLAGRPLVMICGMLSNKDASDYFYPFADIQPHVFTVPVPDEENSYDALDLASIANNVGLDTRPMDSFSECFNEIAEDNAVVLVCGSLYLAGAFLSEIDLLPD